MDIQHYLDGKAVEACPPTLGYRLRKFYRRNHAAVMTIALVAIVLILGTIISTQQAMRATRAEREVRAESERAIRAEQDLQTAFGFLWGDVLSQFSPEQNPDGELKVRTLIDRACDQLDSGPKRSPTIEAMIRGMAGRVYVELGQYSKSQDQLKRALPTLKRDLGPDHLETLASQEALARALIAERTAEKDLSEALQLFTEVWEARSRVQGASHPDTIKCLLHQIDVHFYLGEFEQMEKIARQAVEIARREQGEESVVTAEARLRLAGVIVRWENFAEADDLVKHAVAVLHKTLGPDHPRTLQSERREFDLLFYQCRFEESARHSEENYSRTEQVFGKDHPRTATFIDRIVVSHLLAENYDAAQPWIDKLLDLAPRVHGTNHPKTARALQFSGMAYLGKGEVDTAKTEILKALSIYDLQPVAKHGFDMVNHAWTKSLLGECWLQKNDLVAAERLLLESYAMFQQIGSHPSGKEVWERVLVPKNLDRMVRLYVGLKNPAEAAKWRAELEKLAP